MTNRSNNPGCLGWILQMVGLLPKEAKLPFAQRDDFLSAAEFSFYKVLGQALDTSYVICPKVGLQDIFFVTERDRSEHMAYFNKINRKHVDFLICEKRTMKPVFGIELDDSSHQRQDRVARDEFVNECFKVAGLRLIRVKNKHTYTISEVAEWIRMPAEADPEGRDAALEPRPETPPTSAPLCKKCGIPMVIRTTSKGGRREESFYGCSNFPRCRETLQMSEATIMKGAVR